MRLSQPVSRAGARHLLPAQPSLAGLLDALEANANLVGDNERFPWGTN